MVEHRSVWLATTEQPQYPSLQADLDVDVAVVGGGIVGLTTALLACRQGARVALLEARQVGHGTSGNTTGKVTSQHSLLYNSLIRRHGEEKARQYAEANQAAVHRVAELTDELGIDCDLTWAPSYVWTREPRRRASIEAEFLAARRLGLPATLSESTELPFPVAAAVGFDDQVHFHAGRYLAGLAAGLTEAGAEVFENTRVLDISERRDVVELATSGPGTVRAQQVVLATLLPIRYAGAYFARTRPTRSYGIALRLRGDAPKGMGIGIDSPSRSTRPWLDPGNEGLIVVGNDHETGKQQDTAAAYRDLEAWARDTFDVEAVDYRWSSQDFTTPDKLPYVGRAPLTSRTLVATGFAKWGLSAGTAAAAILTDILADRDNPWLPAFDATRIGGPRTLAGVVKDNLEVGKDFVCGHVGRLKASSLEHLAPGEGRVVEVGGQHVGAYRDPARRVHAVSIVCSHLACTLTWNNAETSWDCPCHGSRFDIDGSVIDGPAVTPLRQVEVEQD
jgi:glycine/D-amino acid oxidase-like deaminating enzyme/nitrite reductase/ring-hydroxylating ferredoxin subunit